MKITIEKMARFSGELKPISYRRNTVFGYRKIIDHSDYAIYQKPSKCKQVSAAYGNTIVKKISSTEFILYPDARAPLFRYRISLKESIFPGLWKGSKILSFLLLPYVRVTGQDAYSNAQRLCVITDQGQIFHNYPARSRECDGCSLPGDIVKFEESVVWDLPGRRFPSPNADHTLAERYFPNLPESCYEYHPLPNDCAGFTDPYHNGGFPRFTKVKNEHGEECTASRFYQNSRNLQANSFYFIGGGSPNLKMSIIGTYRGNVDQGVRTCIFATDDGGRQWYCKYEFSDMGVYDFQQGHMSAWGRNFGNPIVLTGEHKTLDLSNVICYRREICLPAQNNGLPKVSFEWKKCGKACSLRQEENRGVILQFTEKHLLATGNIVTLWADDLHKEDSSAVWLLNENFSDCSGGDGLQFKVEVIDDRAVRLYELVSSAEPSLPCRHIHHINRVRDGWMIGTGEIYPNSWVLYFQMKEADTYSVIHASDYFPLVRLNTSPKSLQRTMGVLFTDEQCPKMIYASDHDVSQRENIPGFFFSRNSTGVYSGALTDLDDRNKFTCVFEAEEPCFYFQNLDGMFVFIGQRGEIGISKDPQLKDWTKDRVKNANFHYMGAFHQFYFFDDIAILRK